MESKKISFPNQKNLKSYRPKVVRLILNYIHWCEVQQLGAPSTIDIQTALGLHIKVTQKLLRKMEADGYINSTIKDKMKHCVLSEKGKNLVRDDLLIHFPQNFQPEIRRVWSSIS